LVTQLNFNEDDIFDFNTINCSPSTVMILESTALLLTQQHSEITNPRHIGILGGRYVLSVDTNITEDRIYLGTQQQPKLACIIIDNYFYI